MMKLNIPNYLFAKTDNIKNKYSKLFFIGYLFSLLKDNNKKYVEFRPSVLFKSFEGLFSKWIIKNTLKQLEEEKRESRTLGVFALIKIFIQLIEFTK